MIVGPVGSASAVALTPILAERSLLACSASATATSLTGDVDAENDAPLTFVRTALRDDHFARIGRRRADDHRRQEGFRPRRP